MKSTEPHSDLYYQMDIEAAMRDAGFQHVVTKEADHRHSWLVLGLLRRATESGLVHILS